VHASKDELLTTPFDSRTGRILGAQVSLLRGVRSAFLPFTDAAHFAVAGNGTLVYVPGSGTPPARTLVWVSPDGTEEPLGLEYPGTGAPRISPDGTRILTSGGGPLYVSDASRRLWTPIVQGMIQASVWSHDSRHIIFTETPDKVFRIREDGSDRELLFTLTGQQLLSPGAWTRNGRWMVFTYGTALRTRLGLLDLESIGRDVQPWKELSDGSSASISPDDDWIAYQSSRSGELHVYIDRFPGVGDPRPVSAPGGGGNPVWSRDGDELFYRRGDGATMSVTVQKKPALEVSEPVVLFESNGYGSAPANRGGGGLRTWDVAPGDRFLTVKEQTPSNAPGDSIVVVQNWFEELKRTMTAP
jgi:hypothetical protein